MDKTDLNEPENIQLPQPTVKQAMSDDELTLVKSNFLIGAAYKSSLAENKILAIALMKVTRKDGCLVSEMTAPYLRKLLLKSGKKNGSFYDKLFDVANKMTDRKVIMQDEEGFDIFHITPRARYKNGIFTVHWDNSIESIIYDIKKNFTILKTPILVGFESVYSFRLYEILKSRAFHPKNSNQPEDEFHVSYSLSELKFKLGAANINDRKVQSYLIPNGKQKDKPDYDKALSMTKDKMFDNWGDFKKRVLDSATKEINEHSDIIIEYEKVCSGKGAKVREIKFTIHLKKDYQAKEALESILTEESDKPQEEIERFIEEISDIIDEPLKYKDLKSIAEVSEYDIENIKKAYEIMKKSTKKITNVTGFLIRAITDNYSDPIEEKGVKEKAKNTFTNISQRNYNYDELERKILEKQFSKEKDEIIVDVQQYSIFDDDKD